ncbi:hypothetical protein D3C72_2520590 [compost metagenome]
MVDVDALYWEKCLYFLEWCIVQIVVLNYIKFVLKTGVTIKNIWFVLLIENVENIIVLHIK